MKPPRILRYATAAAGAGLLGFGGYAAVAWARYGHADPRRHPRDELLDRFMPEPEVDEYHHLKVHAPAAVTFAAARQMDLQASPVAKGIFWLRAVPALLRGEPLEPRGPTGIVAETLGMGWGVLAEVPGREIVIGAYTQPWHEHVTFRSLSPDEFASFSEPGYVKIVWTLAAEPPPDPLKAGSPPPRRRSGRVRYVVSSPRPSVPLARLLGRRRGCEQGHPTSMGQTLRGPTTGGRAASSDWEMSGHDGQACGCPAATTE